MFCRRQLDDSGIYTSLRTTSLSGTMCVDTFRTS